MINHNHDKTYLKKGDFSGEFILEELLEVDGEGSGLDADLIDGINSSLIVLTDGTHPFTQPISGVNPTAAAHLVTKSYLDSTTTSLLSSVSSLYLKKAGDSSPGHFTFTNSDPFSFVGVSGTYHLRIQDGKGRVNWYWNTYGGVPATFLVANEDATDLFFGTTNDGSGSSIFDVRWASGTGKLAGDTINWTTLLSCKVDSLSYLGNTVWHGGNDGSGSGLDADLLDGLQGTSYILTDGTRVFTGIPSCSVTPTSSNHLVNKSYVDGLIASNDAMVFKGVIDASTNPNYPAANRGETYKISVAGKIGGSSGPNVEIGDLVMCITDSTATGTQAVVGAQWVIVQTNIDGAVTGPTSSTSGHIPTFNGTSGKVIQDSGYGFETSLTGSTTAIPSSSAIKSYVDTSISTNSTHGIISSSHTITGASSNQLIGINSGNTALEYKSVAGVTGNITVTHSTNSVTLDVGANIATALNTSGNTILLQNKSGTTLSTVTVPYATTSGSSTTATKLATARTISLTSDVTGSTSFDGSANISITSTLANSGVTAGTYNNATTIYPLTIDAKGRVTSVGTGIAITPAKLATARTISSTGDVTWSTSFDGSANATGTATLANSGVTAGTYNNATTIYPLTIDAKGRVTSVGTGIAINGTALSADKLTTARTISSTGDVTWSTSFDGSANATGTATLANSGVTAGTYNNVATQVRPFTIDIKGRVTSIGTAVTITPAWTSITGKPTTADGMGLTDVVYTTKNSTVLDSIMTYWGTGNDLSLEHDGTNSFIANSTGILQLRQKNTNAINLVYYNGTSDEAMLSAIPNGAVNAYYDSVKKLETTTNGIKVSGQVNVNDKVIILYNDTTSSLDFNFI